MRASTLGDSAIGRLFGTRRARSGTAAMAMQTPSAPPMPRQHQAFGHQVAHQPFTSCAHRRPHGQLATPFHRSGEQQVGEVGAGNQQHAGGRAGERHEQHPRAARTPRARIHGGAGVAAISADTASPSARRGAPIPARTSSMRRGLCAGGRSHTASCRSDPGSYPRRTSSSSRARRRWPGTGSPAA